MRNSSVKSVVELQIIKTISADQWICDLTSIFNLLEVWSNLTYHPPEDEFHSIRYNMLPNDQGLLHVVGVHPPCNRLLSLDIEV